MSRSRFRIQIVSGLIVALLPFAAFADPGTPSPGVPDSNVATEDSKVATEDSNVATEDSPNPDARRVYALSGATITWDLKGKRMQPPNEEQAVVMAEQFAEWMDAKLSGEGKTPSAEVKVETLASGIKKARLPVHLMNAALVRVDAEGHLEGVCSEVHEVHSLGETVTTETVATETVTTVTVTAEEQ